MFAFMQSKLRGRYSITNIPGRSTTTELANLPVIPGMMISINCHSRTVTVTDPLAEDKNAELLETLNAIVKHEFGNERKPHPAVIRRDVSNDDLKSVLCELASWLSIDKITVHAGTLPDFEDCQGLPANRRINPYDSNPEAPKYEGDPDLRRQTVVQMGPAA